VGLGAETKEWRPALPLIFAVGGIPGVARDTTPAIITAPCHRSININKQNGRRAAAHAGDETRSRGQGAPGKPSLCLLQAYSMARLRRWPEGPAVLSGCNFSCLLHWPNPRAWLVRTLKHPKIDPQGTLIFPVSFRPGWLQRLCAR
jgi:hypothetical protein